MNEEEIGQWHTRGYLPHYESRSVIQMVTFRLADSLPRHVAERLAEESDTLEGNAAYRKRIEAWLDAGHGECLLRNPRAAKIVEDSFLLYHGKRYLLHGWVIMPNHVHLLVRMLSTYALSSMIQGWKSFTTRQINQLLCREGTVWQREYWDRYIRNQHHYDNSLAYIHENPVKAGLVTCPEDWPWSSARVRRSL